jgi:hypothetical protein
MAERDSLIFAAADNEPSQTQQVPPSATSGHRALLTSLLHGNAAAG